MASFFITLVADEINEAMSCMLGDGPVRITDGYGGWETVDIPKRIGITSWKGRNPYMMEVPVMIDGHAENRSVETAIKSLEKMALPTGDGEEPPVIDVDGPIPHRDFDYVINDIEWLTGDSDIVVNSAGHRIRQACVLTLLQFVEDRHIRRLSIKKQKKYKIYKVKKGDTLQSIAKKFLKDAKLWKVLAKLNKIRDPKKLKPGMKIKIPIDPKMTSKGPKVVLGQ